MTATVLPDGAPAELRLEDIAQRSTDIWLKTLQPYAAIFAALAVPAALLTVLFMPHGGGRHTLWPFWIVTVIGAALDVLAFTIVLPGCWDAVQGQPRPARALVDLARQRLAALLTTAACVGVAVGVGLAFYIAPGAILAALLCMALPACALEGLGPVASLRRSIALTEGNRLTVGIILFALLVLGIVAGTVAGIGQWVLGRYLGAVALVAVNGVFGVLITSVAVVVYGDLLAIRPQAPAENVVEPPAQSTVDADAETVA